jgi:hypothetical protein
MASISRQLTNLEERLLEEIRSLRAEVEVLEKRIPVPEIIPAGVYLAKIDHVELRKSSRDQAYYNIKFLTVDHNKPLYYNLMYQTTLDEFAAKIGIGWKSEHPLPAEVLISWEGELVRLRVEVKDHWRDYGKKMNVVEEVLRG